MRPEPLSSLEIIFLILGMAIITGLTESPNEDLSALLGEMFAGIAVPLDANVYRASRIGKSTDTRPNRRVIVKFTREEDRNLVLSRKCNLKTVSDRKYDKVFIQEDLTPQQREHLTQMYHDAEEKNSRINLVLEKWIVAGRRSQPFLKKVKARHALPTENAHGQAQPNQ